MVENARNSGFRETGILLLLAASVLIHLPGDRADFTFDDFHFVPQNQSIRSLEGALGAFAATFPPERPERGLYRPLTNLSYAFDYALWGVEARGYHLTNVCLYALVVWLFYALVRAHGGSAGVGLCAALVFSLHPVHTEAVDGIAGRSELLALIFSLICVLLFRSALGGVPFVPRREAQLGASRVSPAAGVALAAGAWLAYVLASLSKETGVVVPGVLALQVLMRSGVGRREHDGQVGVVRLTRASLALIPFALWFVAYLSLRMSVVGHFGPAEPALAEVGFWGRLHTIGAVILEYLRLLVWPSVLQLDFYYQEAVGIQSGASVRSWTGLTLFAMAVAGSAVGLAGYLRGPRGQAGGAVLLAACIFFAFLIPVSHVIDFGALMAERFLLAPSAGFVWGSVLLVAMAMARLIPEKRLRSAGAMIVMIPLCAAGAWRSMERAQEWRSDVALWRATDRVLPDDYRVYANLGAAYLHRDELENAKAALTRAVELNPEFASPRNNLAFVQMRRGDLDAARQNFERVVALKPKNYIAWNNLGVIATRALDHSRAQNYYERALAANPNYPKAAENLVLARVAIRQARTYLAAHSAEAPEGADLKRLMKHAVACFTVGDYECAQRHHQRVGVAQQSTEMAASGQH